MNTLVDGLNDAQKKAVLTTEGPLLIVAGAGAGKTKTVTHRIGYLVTQGVRPGSILAVTFTNKAAKEMRERVHHLLNSLPDFYTEGDMPFVATFHSLGVFLLRRFGVYETRVKRFTVLDDNDTMSLLKECYKELGLDVKQHDPRKIKNVISTCANAGRTHTDLQSESNPTYRLAGNVWRLFAGKKRAQKAVDFDDLLLESLRLLETDSEARNWCTSAWKYIHVDEYQDTNEVQYKMAKILAGENKNICVVGDSDQSIYSWRGANIKNILEFERDYKDATTILLEENYRSTKTVIAAANEIIQKNTYRQDKALFTNNTDGELISLYTAYDETDEANFIAERAIEAIDSGTKPSEIAVLFRTNFQSRVLEEAFLSLSVPYQLLGVRFFERKEIKEVLSYLRAVYNRDSLYDVARSINTPARGIGKVTLAKLFAEGVESLTGKARISVEKYFEVLDAIEEHAHHHSISEVVKFTIQKSGIETMYKEDSLEGGDRLENLQELVTIALRYEHLDTLKALEKLLEDATLASDQDSLDTAKKNEQQNAVKLMTIHAAKGLEFDTVFLAGLEQGLFPHERDGSSKQGADAEEERRLMYVAITRARKKLYITYASIRTIFGMRDVRLPSEFLLDIPEELCTRETRSGEAGFSTVVYL